MITVRVKFPPKGVCRIKMATMVYLTRQGNYSYLLVSSTERFNYFLTLHKGQVEIERHGTKSEFMLGLRPHSKCGIKHAAKIYMTSTLPKTDQAMEVLDAIMLSSLDRVNFFSYQPVEREKRERLTKKERTRLKANTIKLEKICDDLGVEPSVVRSRFRRKGIERPGGKWAWPKSQVSEIIKQIKLLMHLK